MEKPIEKHGEAGAYYKGASASQAQSETLVTLVLDMHPHQFREVESEFVTDLSQLMGHKPSDIKIVAVREGCTETDIRIPIDGKDIIGILKSRGKTGRKMSWSS